MKKYEILEMLTYMINKKNLYECKNKARFIKKKQQKKSIQIVPQEIGPPEEERVKKKKNTNRCHLRINFYKT
jgi:hypothetical protein